MKKSTFFSLCAIFIVYFTLITIGDKNIAYEKEIEFKTPEEAIASFIGYINIYEEFKTDDRNSVIINSTKEFKESVSKRYRIYINKMNHNQIYGQVPLFIDYTLKEISFEDSKELEFQYNESLSGIPNYNKPNELRVYELIGEGIMGTYNRSDVKISKTGEVEINDYNDESEISKKEFNNYIDKSNYKVLFVVVDEGEGYVVDYYMQYWEE